MSEDKEKDKEQGQEQEQEKPAILKDYTFIKDIGEGNFGKVKLSILNSTKEKYAIKILNKEKLKSQTKTTLFNEIEIMSQLKHPNIVYVEKILEDQQNFYIIMEYCEKGELFDYIVKKQRLSPIEASMFFYQIINGVEYIHSQGLVHRDLKPENLLLTKNKLLKIIDFGLCHDFDETKYLSTKCGSPSYAAPEILKGFPYDGFKTDVWCCGIILYAMLCGYLPFDGDDNQEIFQSIVEGELEFPNFLEEDSINLLLWLLNPEPKERISIEEIKYHPFYLKGKSYFIMKYGDIYNENENDCILDDSNDMIQNQFLNYNSIERKNYGLSTNRRKKENFYNFNNNNIKTIKVKENKHFKNNIYQNIFNNIININIENSNTKKEKSPYLLTSFNNGNKQNIDATENAGEGCETKINNNNIQKIPIIMETEVNKDKSSLLLESYSNKNNNINELKNKNEKKDLSFIKSKFKQYNYDKTNSKLNSISYNSKSQNKKNDSINNKINFISLDINKFNQYNSLGKKNNKKIYARNNKYFNDKPNFILKNKNKHNPNNIKKIKIAPEQLDFFQKFIINKNKINQKSSEISPKKNVEMAITRRKENNHEGKNEKDNIHSEQKRILSGNKKKIDIKDRIIFSTKKKQNINLIKKDKDKKKERENNIIFNNKINIISSPVRNLNEYYQQNINNKNINSVFRYELNNNGKNDNINIKSLGNNTEKTNYGCRSCTNKKKHHRKNLIIEVNKKLNDLKLVSINNNKSLSIKKEEKNNKYIYKNRPELNINNNVQNVNMILKTEPKNNHFLDKVLQKINSNKTKKTNIDKKNILLTDNNFKKEDKQLFRFLNLEKKIINENLGNPNTDKINTKPQIHLFTINKKFKDKRLFPSLIINNRK